MDLNKTGQFISAMRKQKDMTQKELADRIGVTDKAVSRWETGKGFPDVSILKTLSEVLEVSITEIVNGETVPPEEVAEKADNALIDALSYSKKMSRKVVGIVMLIFGIGLIAFPPLFIAQVGLSIFSIFGAALLVFGIAVLCIKKPLSMTTVFQFEKRFAGVGTIIMLAVTLVLQSLPHGAVLIFSDGPDIRLRQTYSYFSLVTFGYANFFPLITAILTAVIFALSIAAFIKNYSVKRVQNSTFICTIITVLFSILSWIMFGSQYVTGSGIAISILLFASLVPQAFSNRD
jgi:transcriptional regulator with XRE-family HTH domain